MYVYVKQSTVGLMVAVLLLLTLAPVAPAHAITDTDLREQKLVVMGSLVETMREQVKLLQMAFIQKLERQVDDLEARLAAR